MFSQLKNSEPFVIAHRGGAGLWPENTLFSLEEAKKLGADFSEIDLRMSRDGVLVVIHDESVDRTTEGRGLVQEMTLAELKKLDAGYRWTQDKGKTFPFRGQGIKIPTLNEVFSQFPQQYFNLEIKQYTPPIVAAVCETILRHNKAKQIIVSAFDAHTMKVFRRLCSNVTSVASESEVNRFIKLTKLHLHGLFSNGANDFSIPLEKVNPLLVKAAHKKNKKIIVWTVNELDAMQQMLEWKVDGIITDFPDRLLALLKSTSS